MWNRHQESHRSLGHPLSDVCSMQPWHERTHMSDLTSEWSEAVSELFWSLINLPHMNHIMHLFWVDLSHVIKHSIAYMHSACMSGMWLMEIMTLDCTLQKTLWWCADVMISQLSVTINKLNKLSHLSIADSIYMQCIPSVVYILSITGSLCIKEVV